ncbi:ABC transporter permease [Raoultibacter phocaeensis]|uniref:ABC transporter permease n=1 Tax=Raoultibacter phocaeensis TaxID=2479841 RepID=UPI00111BCD1D|nr:ABC transporter permease [Raoultibacter phocaeensis]
MQAFKAALRIVLNHPVYLLVYVGFLSCMGVFISASINAGVSDEGTYTAAKAPLAVIDRDGSELSENLTAYLDETGELVEVADDPFAMQDAVATGMVTYLLVVPEGFENDYLAAARSGQDEPVLESTFSYGTMAGTLVDEQVNQYLGLVRATAVLEPDASVASILERANGSIAEAAAVETVQTPNAALPADRFAFYLQWGSYTMTAAIVVCVGLLMSAFNRTDVHRRNLVAPVSTLRLGLQKAIACLLVTIGVWAVTCGIGLIAFGSSLEGVPVSAVALVLFAAFVFSLVPLSLGFFLGQIGANEMVANAVGNIAGMVISFLGGAWISLDLLAPEVQTLSRFIPTSWYTEAVGQAIHLTELTPATVLPVLGDIGVVALFAVALFAVALAVGRLNLRSAEAGGNAAAAKATV